MDRDPHISSESHIRTIFKAAKWFGLVLSASIYVIYLQKHDKADLTCTTLTKNFHQSEQGVLRGQIRHSSRSS